MARLTKLNRQKILDQNEGFTANTSYDSRNSSYDRQYMVKGGKLYIQESGKTSWADSRYKKNGSLQIKKLTDSYMITSGE